MIKPKLSLNVTGTFHNNDDGISRQAILKRTKEGENIILAHIPIEQDTNAVAVFRMNGEQIGWLHRSTARIIASLLDSKRIINAEIEEISGESSLECRIAIVSPDIIAELKSGYEQLQKRE